MADTTKIEWADATFNPWIGCTKVSPACDHCYAEAWNARFGHGWGPHTRRRTSHANWRKPVAWNRTAEAEGRRIRYSPEELTWIEARRTWPRRQLHAAFVRAFGRTDVSAENLKRFCVRQGWTTGRDGRFPAGHVPANKGRTGFHPPGSEKGWFKPGVRRGAAMHLYKPVGTERISKDGYLERKVNDDLPAQRRWRGVHLIRWEAENGPLPEGMCLKCLDGDRANTEPANWKAIPRALLPRLAAGRWFTPYDDAPPELRPTILAAAELDHAARQARKGRR